MIIYRGVLQNAPTYKQQLKHSFYQKITKNTRPFLPYNPCVTRGYGSSFDLACHSNLHR